MSIKPLSRVNNAYILKQIAKVFHSHGNKNADSILTCEKLYFLHCSMREFLSDLNKRVVLLQESAILQIN